MIHLTDIDGRAVYVAASNIARINAAGVSSQWHGVRSIVRLLDGGIIEAREDAKQIAKAVEAEQQQQERV